MSVRIISGLYKGRILEAPSSARPTLSRFRQSLFDILEAMESNFFYDKTVMDCFAGAGALGMEALSRGAKYSYFIDSNLQAVNVLYTNARALDVLDKCYIMRKDVTKLRNPTQEQCDVFFLDPPYGKVSIKKTIEQLESTRWLAEKAILITEEDGKNTEDLSFLRLIAYKQQGVSLFRVFEKR